MLLFIIIFHKNITTFPSCSSQIKLSKNFSLLFFIKKVQELKNSNLDYKKKKIVTFHFFWKNSRTLQLVLHVLPRFLNLKIEALIVGWVNKEKKRKKKNRLSSLTLSLLNLSSPIHSQQEQLSWSQDPNNMNTQNQDQNSRSQDLNSMTHKTNSSKTQTT